MKCDLREYKMCFPKNILSYRLTAVIVISGYRTASDEQPEAITVGIRMLIDIMANEARKLFEERRTRSSTIKEIKGKNSNGIRARMAKPRKTHQHVRWTYKIIPNIKKWIKRKLLFDVRTNTIFPYSGRGIVGYRKNLYRFGRSTSSMCPKCPKIEKEPY